MSNRVLVFPAGMPRSLAFLEQALLDGFDVIGASSLAHDVAKESYPEWCYLPYVTDEAFNEALRVTVEEHGVTEIFTPNIVVWNYLKRTLPEICPSISLLNSSPLDREVQPYRRAIEFAQDLNSTALTLGAAGEPLPLLDTLHVAALFHHSDLIPGMCDHEKIKALYAIVRYSPPGDVVEIGSWWGKSAFILGFLAKQYSIGQVLCVDPWSTEHMIQGDSKGLVDSVTLDTDGALEIFQINLLPYMHGVLNYLRLPSAEASRHFRQHKSANSEAFGVTCYQGSIAILHIDGNHSYDHVLEDVTCWADMVVPGGWIIFDDYVWPYGDGPKQVGDNFLKAHASGVDLAFVMGSALFVRLSGAVL